MTENVMTAPAVEATPQPLYPLSQAREQQGVHIAVLAVALKVSVKKLEALEAGRFEDLPGYTFARALAASACRHLKIDPAPVLALIPQAESPRLGYAETSVEAPFQSPSLMGTRSVLLSRSAVLGALVLLIGALAVLFWPSIPLEAFVTSEATATPAAPVSPPASDDTADTGSPVPAAATASVPAPVAVSPSPTSPVSEPLVPVSPAQAPAAAPVPTTASAGADSAQAVAPSENLMSIRATSDSWVEVRSVGGPVLLRRLLKSGEVVDFSAPPPYNVLLGRVDAAVVTVRGQPFDTTPFARNSVARFEVK